jgi:hypothetical protein
MKGVFRLYQEGRLVAEVENTVTTAGKRLIQRYLAGQSANLGDAIGIGTMGSPSSAVGDVRLNFEITRVPVALKSADFTNNVIVFKGTLPQDDVYAIFEMGLWSQYSNALAAGFESRLLTTFNTVIEPWTNVTLDTTNVRSSIDSAKVTVGVSATVQTRNSNVLMDLSGFSGNDFFALSFYKPDNNMNSIKFVFEDLTGGGNYSSSAISISALPIGFNTITATKGSLTQTGTVSWANITRYGFDIAANASGSNVSLDAFRIEDTDTINQDYALVSHTTNATVLATKTAVAPMDIEYSLGVTVS